MAHHAADHGTADGAHRAAASEDGAADGADGSGGFGATRADKYWPPVRRVDQAYGDRNLVCSCMPIEAFA